MTLYMRYVDKHGNVTVQAHQVWDKERFVEARQADQMKEGGSVTEVDADTYRRHNWPDKN